MGLDIPPSSPSEPSPSASPLPEKGRKKGYRLVNTKYPPIELFDDVASAEEFELLYAIQTITNPRLQDQIGNISLIACSEIPYHCKRGKSYAVAPFTHINPNGGRFNDGLFGAFYLASDQQTAAIEVKYHQQRYWENIENLHYDRFLFRGFIVSHAAQPIYTVDAHDSRVLDSDSYIASQQLARQLKKQGYQAVHYPSVRHQGGECWALFTPRPIYDVVQSYLLEMIWDGKTVAEVNRVNNLSSG